MSNPVVHFEVMGNHGEQLRSYYSELFGWEIDANNPMGYGTVASSGEGGIGGGVGESPAGYEGHVTFYVRVEDVEAALAKAESLGGARVMGPHEVTDGLTIAQFTDPDGHLIGLVEGGE